MVNGCLSENHTLKYEVPRGLSVRPLTSEIESPSLPHSSSRSLPFSSPHLALLSLYKYTRASWTVVTCPWVHIKLFQLDRLNHNLKILNEEFHKEANKNISMV